MVNLTWVFLNCCFCRKSLSSFQVSIICSVRFLNNFTSLLRSCRVLTISYLYALSFFWLTSGLADAGLALISSAFAWASCFKLLSATFNARSFKQKQRMDNQKIKYRKMLTERPVPFASIYDLDSALA